MKRFLRYFGKNPNPKYVKFIKPRSDAPIEEHLMYLTIRAEWYLYRAIRNAEKAIRWLKTLQFLTLLITALIIFRLTISNIVVTYLGANIAGLIIPILSLAAFIITAAELIIFNSEAAAKLYFAAEHFQEIVDGVEDIEFRLGNATISRERAAREYRILYHKYGGYKSRFVEYINRSERYTRLSRQDKNINSYNIELPKSE